MLFISYSVLFLSSVCVGSNVEVYFIYELFIKKKNSTSSCINMDELLVCLSGIIHSLSFAVMLNFVK